MFTGVVQAVGEVEDAAEQGRGVRLRIRADDWPYSTTLGESICVGGVCLTVAESSTSSSFRARFDVVRETLNRTTLGALRAGARVNLEPALRLDSPLSGHIVHGHVDGVGEVVALAQADRDTRLRVRLPSEVADLTPRKGSIALEGVSLTVADAVGDEVEIALIPETLARTTLGQLRTGDPVNVEADPIARIVARLMVQRSE